MMVVVLYSHGLYSVSYLLFILLSKYMVIKLNIITDVLKLPVALKLLFDNVIINQIVYHYV